MDNSDPVSPRAYWLPASLILQARPMGAVANRFRCGDEGAERVCVWGGVNDREIEVKAEKIGEETGDVWRGRKMESDKDGGVE